LPAAPMAPAERAQRPLCGLESALGEVVERRRAVGLLRTLSTRPPGHVDFCSNDYIGLAASKQLACNIDLEMAAYRQGRESEGDFGLGSTGSRLLTGNSQYAEETESMLAAFHSSESALLFNSGFDANFALFAYLPQKGDVVVYDELVHASVREGLRSSRARSVPFKHNDVEALRRVLAEVRSEDSSGKQNIIIAIETVYSMDGHCAPLHEICSAAEEVGAAVVADEAHGTGVFGPEGRGWASELGAEERIFSRVHTFGKGLGVHGAIVTGPRVLYEYLVNYARPLIYSTSLPMHSIVSIRCAYAMMRESAMERQQHLKSLIDLFCERLKRLPAGFALSSPSPIQGVIVPGNKECVEVSRMLSGRGFHVLPIRSPTVPAGTERLRIILHYHNTEEEVNSLMDAVEDALRTLGGKSFQARL